MTLTIDSDDDNDDISKYLPRDKSNLEFGYSVFNSELDTTSFTWLCIHDSEKWVSIGLDTLCLAPSYFQDWGCCLITLTREIIFGKGVGKCEYTHYIFATPTSLWSTEIWFDILFYYSMGQINTIKKWITTYRFVRYFIAVNRLTINCYLATSIA